MISGVQVTATQLLNTAVSILLTILTDLALTLRTNFAVVSGGAFTLAVIVYGWMYLRTQALRGTDVQLIQPVRDSAPSISLWRFVVPGVTFLLGVKRLLQNLHSIYVEIAKTRTPEKIRDIPNGSRFWARGETRLRTPVTGPVSGEDGAVVFWSIDVWTGTRWKQKSSSLASGRFDLLGVDDYGESIVVNPGRKADYDLSGATMVEEVVEENEPVPDQLRDFLQEHAPFSSGALRFREVLLREDEDVSVFGVMKEKNHKGRWERTAVNPESGDVRLVISTEPVSDILRDVWRDISAGTVVSLLLIGFGAAQLAVFTHLFAVFA